ncbi:hypothetical protein [Phytohabitans kaempferiae]|uniref:Glycoside hydrolase family 5 domain-containing protein n=1 Tax=Phytohabitans kaempferiae TaxID=1620943 RepID=A0ABV6MC13_9ACTN
MTLVPRDYRGFNYSGSWGTSALDLWQHHDHGLMAVEIARGKGYFPGWNVARWWLSHESYQRKPARFLANFEAGLNIFADHGIAVMPVLFNRWRDPTCDFGGVPLEHIVPWFTNQGNAPDLFQDDDLASRDVTRVQLLFSDYLRAVVGEHLDDPRIAAWDICNEPFSGPYLHDDSSEVRAAEVRWLDWCYRAIKRLGAAQPLTVGNRQYVKAVQLTEHISDFLTFHPYYVGSLTDRENQARWEDRLDQIMAIGRAAGKEVAATETIWGALDDAAHVALAEYTLGELRKRDLGFIVHALHHSLVADLHFPEYGPVGPPECLHFINADGSLRAGHEIFNRFV